MCFISGLADQWPEKVWKVSKDDVHVGAQPLKVSGATGVGLPGPPVDSPAVRNI